MHLEMIPRNPEVTERSLSHATWISNLDTTYEPELREVLPYQTTPKNNWTLKISKYLKLNYIAAKRK